MGKLSMLAATSFSTTTVDSESTLVENDVAANIDNFLMNSHVHLKDSSTHPRAGNFLSPGTSITITRGRTIPYQALRRSHRGTPTKRRLMLGQICLLMARAGSTL